MYLYSKDIALLMLSFYNETKLILLENIKKTIVL